MSRANRTPLYDKHVAHGAKLIEFGGWDMPVSYSDITTEHHHTRTKAGLFDLCHMGRVAISGPDAAELVQVAQTNDVSKIPPNKIRYAMLLLEDGGVVDDILVHQRGHDIFLVVNASNRQRDVELLKKLAQGRNVIVDDQSDQLAMIAIQGPESANIVQALAPQIDLSKLKYYSLVEGPIHHTLGMITRTGYTGEDGFELYVPTKDISGLWERALVLGQEVPLLPCGLGARDTLRLEAGMPLYGHEITESINPIEADLMFGVRLDKAADFVGKTALKTVEKNGPARHLIGLMIDGRRIPRQGYPVLINGQPAGFVASGTWSPTFDCAIATALVSASQLEKVQKIEVDVRGKPAAAQRVQLPFYKRDGSGSLQQKVL